VSAASPIRSTAILQTGFFMHRRSCARICLLSAAVLLAAGASNRLAAQTVWSGLTKSFTKPDGADGTLPANQDELTPNVTIARRSSEGIYNGFSEPNFLAGTSPEFTEWATSLVAGNEGQSITATNWAALTFTDWVDAYGGQDPDELQAALLSNNAVVHLTLDNIYLDLKFTAWGAPGAGGFSYLRAQPPGPTGDYNGNHIVDAADYTVWRDHLGQNVSPNGTGADGNSSGKIDSGDYTVWKMNFGNHSPGAGGGAATQSAVPEPTSLGLLALGSLLPVMLRAVSSIRRL
jgi:hypothetical protein